MSTLFSNKTRCFYISEDENNFKAAKTWPSDLIEVSDEERDTFCGAAPVYQVPEVDKKTGKMKWVKNPALDIAAEILKNNTLIQEGKLKHASLVALPLQSAIALGDTSEAKKENLIIIQQYIVDLMSVDLTDKEPAWPELIL
ncbi:tail fiber assembly protein [Rahnella aceris]|uniref:tail fiber assembly protein n=1 Tax=Rahnella sp. (strain Y9602) TaxID=2703885 RepID=UPI001C26AD61|nr:tail fiber assembly protein [Rahnella aceris]MBU9866827.1 tail fiber assembly protein [Rahnella aceris]